MLSLPSSSLEKISDAEEDQANKVHQTNSNILEAQLSQPQTFVPVDISRLLDDNGSVHEGAAELIKYRKHMIAESSVRMKATRQSLGAIHRYAEHRCTEDCVRFALKKGKDLSDEELMIGMDELVRGNG